MTLLAKVLATPCSVACAKMQMSRAALSSLPRLTTWECGCNDANELNIDSSCELVDLYKLNDTNRTCTHFVIDQSIGDSAQVERRICTCSDYEPYGLTAR